MKKLEKIFLENFFGAWFLGMVVLCIGIGALFWAIKLLLWVGVGFSLVLFLFLGVSACIGASIQEDYERSKKLELPSPDWKKIGRN